MSTTTRLPLRRQLVRWAVPALALLAGVPALLVALRSYRLERAMCFPERHATSAEPAALGLSGAEPVAIRDGASTLKGWYLRSRTRAATLLIHGAGGNRASLAAEGSALHRAGFGALLLELPGHGESDGQISWGLAERDSIRAALSWLAQQPDVDPQRIGGFGFSLGGYVLAQVAAEDPRLRAIALAGTPSDLAARLKRTHERFGLLGSWPAELAFQRAGTNPAINPAVSAVQRLASRPLLVVTGDRDELVPESMARALYQSAGARKELLVVQGAGHGGYAEAQPGSYAARVVEFFQGGLLERGLEAG